MEEAFKFRLSPKISFFVSTLRLAISFRAPRTGAKGQPWPPVAVTKISFFCLTLCVSVQLQADVKKMDAAGEELELATFEDDAALGRGYFSGRGWCVHIEYRSLVCQRLLPGRTYATRTHVLVDSNGHCPIVLEADALRRLPSNWTARADGVPPGRTADILRLAAEQVLAVRV